MHVTTLTSLQSRVDAKPLARGRLLPEFLPSTAIRHPEILPSERVQALLGFLKHLETEGKGSI